MKCYFKEPCFFFSFGVFQHFQGIGIGFTKTKQNKNPTTLQVPTMPTSGLSHKNMKTDTIYFQHDTYLYVDYTYGFGSRDRWFHTGRTTEKAINIMVQYRTIKYKKKYY